MAEHMLHNCVTQGNEQSKCCKTDTWTVVSMMSAAFFRLVRASRLSTFIDTSLNSSVSPCSSCIMIRRHETKVRSAGRLYRPLCRARIDAEHLQQHCRVAGHDPVHSNDVSAHPSGIQAVVAGRSGCSMRLPKHCPLAPLPAGRLCQQQHQQLICQFLGQHIAHQLTGGRLPQLLI